MRLLAEMWADLVDLFPVYLEPLDMGEDPVLAELLAQIDEADRGPHGPDIGLMSDEERIKFVFGDDIE
jgi:hypothetical protein